MLVHFHFCFLYIQIFSKINHETLSAFRKFYHNELCAFNPHMEVIILSYLVNLLKRKGLELNLYYKFLLLK